MSDITYLSHHGIKGQKWYQRRYQNEDGTLTSAGRLRYGIGSARIKSTAKSVGRMAKFGTELAKAKGQHAVTSAVSNSSYKFRRAQNRLRNLNPEHRANARFESGTRQMLYSSKKQMALVNLQANLRAQARYKELKNKGRILVANSRAAASAARYGSEHRWRERVSGGYEYLGSLLNFGSLTPSAYHPMGTGYELNSKLRDMYENIGDPWDTIGSKKRYARGSSIRKLNL